MTLTMDNFDAVGVGEYVDAPGVFKGLADEPLKLRAAAREEHKIEFVVTYFGVTLGRWKCLRNEEKLQWQT